MFTQASAASVAPSRTAALPVSVRRKSRSGVSTLRAQAVRPANTAVGCDSGMGVKFPVARGPPMSPKDRESASAFPPMR